jgi:thiol:disulfide interchange protein/DsbC/DsbD-like thiol-disulfide interchange protein
MPTTQPLIGGKPWPFVRHIRRVAIIMKLLPALTLAGALAAPIAARAAESNRFVSHEDTVSIVSKSDDASGLSLRLGLLFRLSKEWHVYWKNAGDTGLPPQLTLTRPPHVTTSAFDWPAPNWLVTNGLGNYVVSGTVLLPFTVSLPRAVPAQRIDLRGNAHWLVCSAVICVPQQASFSLHLPEGAASASTEAGLFASAHEAEPRSSPFEATISAGGVLTVTGEGLGGSDVTTAHFFPDRPDAIVNAAPQRLNVRPMGFSLALKPLKWSPKEPLTGVLEITDGAGSRQALTVLPKLAAPGPVLSGAMLWWSALGALLGGLLLNLMPCVFPVLAIKALSVTRLGGEGRLAIRVQALAYTAGVVLTMLIVGGALESLRAAGAQLGWGFQFQSPAFVTFTAWLVFAIGLNLAGVFEFSSRFGGVGSTLAAREGVVGNFVTGLVAVAVATPCTAPFMGAAIAFALAAPAIFGLGIFLFLGVGMALPFLVIGFFPMLGALLPRPGKWTEVLRQLLAFPMFATVIWLLWVVAREAGATGVLVAVTGTMLLGFALWLLRFGGRILFMARLAVAVGTLGLLPLITPARAGGERFIPGAIPYSAEKLASLRAAGTPVLVDMSAAWCITCLVNERVALDNGDVQAALRARHAVIMTGDWTDRDPAITAYLETHHRDGVPLYVYYPPSHTVPIVLPQILTPSIIRRVLRDDVE